MTLPAPAFLLLVATLALAVACGGHSGDGDDELFPRVVTLGEGDVFLAIRNSALGVGENRLSIGLLDRDDEPILGAEVHLRFFDLNGAEPALKSEADARFVPVTLSFVDEGAGGERVDTGDDGVYVAPFTFDREGAWGMEARVTSGGKTYDRIPFRFVVLPDTPEPGIGDAAPPSVQQTLATASSVEEIDSSFPPRPQMHDVAIADALRRGQPLVIAFATPAFCRSRTCAPVMDAVMDPLYAAYGDRATFIHIEPYSLPELRQANIQNAVPALRQWRLETEPWIFVVGGDGRIVAKFEGIAGRDEVEEALMRALEAPPPEAAPTPV
ncbi:MAG: hypothetical protein WEC75_05290 [Dehalococcoidia bacterium]